LIFTGQRRHIVPHFLKHAIGLGQANGGKGRLAGVLRALARTNARACLTASMAMPDQSELQTMWEKGASSGRGCRQTAWAESVPRPPSADRAKPELHVPRKPSVSQPDKGFIVYCRGAPSPAPDRWLPRRRHGGRSPGSHRRFAIRDDRRLLGDAERVAGDLDGTLAGAQVAADASSVVADAISRCCRRVVQVGAKEGRLLA